METRQSKLRRRRLVEPLLAALLLAPSLAAAQQPPTPPVEQPRPAEPSAPVAPPWVVPPAALAQSHRLHPLRSNEPPVAAKRARRRRIIDGTEAPEEKDDGIVAILFGRGDICSGVAISPEWVLTAGHCTCGDAASYRIIVGPHAKLFKRAEFKVGRILRFPGYDCNKEPAQLGGLDIGLVKTADGSDSLPSSATLALLGDAIRTESQGPCACSGTASSRTAPQASAGKR